MLTKIKTFLKKFLSLFNEEQTTPNKKSHQKINPVNATHFTTGDLNKNEIAKRLKEFLKKNFGTIDKGAVAIGTTGNTLRSSYLNGRSKLSVEMVENLKNVGCDITWLLTGIKENDKLKKELIELRSQNLQLKRENHVLKNKFNY